jgi:hypothetical protein
VHSCTHWLRPRNPTPPPSHLCSYTRALLLVSQDRRHLFMTPWSPPWTQKGRATLSCWLQRAGGPNSDDWTESLALCVLCALRVVSVLFEPHLSGCTRRGIPAVSSSTSQSRIRCSASSTGSPARRTRRESSHATSTCSAKLSCHDRPQCIVKAFISTCRESFHTSSRYSKKGSAAAFNANSQPQQVAKSFRANV